jgi:cytochrome c oxidase subunit 2
MLAGSAAIFLAASAALAVAWRRPRSLGARPSRILILWGGLILPSVMLVALVLAAFALGERLIAPSGSAAPLRIEAQGRQWVWEFRYPEVPGLSTVDTLHIPAGREIEFAVTSADVVHSFWVPRLGGKIDAIPGHENRIRLVASRPGTYGGVCAEFCGTGHGPMRFTVVAHAAGDYDAVLARLAAGDQR